MHKKVEAFLIFRYLITLFLYLTTSCWFPFSFSIKMSQPSPSVCVLHAQYMLMAFSPPDRIVNSITAASTCRLSGDKAATPSLPYACAPPPLCVLLASEFVSLLF